MKNIFSKWYITKNFVFERFNIIKFEYSAFGRYIKDFLKPCSMGNMIKKIMILTVFNYNLYVDIILLWPCYTMYIWRSIILDLVISLWNHYNNYFYRFFYYFIQLFPSMIQDMLLLLHLFFIKCLGSGVDKDVLKYPNRLSQVWPLHYRSVG